MAAFLPFAAGTANAIVEGGWVVVVVAAAAACRRRRRWWWWWWLLSPMQNSLFHVDKQAACLTRKHMK
jgi:MYXO-CTERM domain-containing protein